jgi:dolichol-phosphate mannosyltransferase
MLDLLDGRPDLQLVVGTRYSDGGGRGGLDATRRKMSALATRLADFVSRTPVTDPMSGFFVLRREAFMKVAHNLSDQGFKILLDILASSRPPLKVGEVPYEFRNRAHGESKLDTAVAWQYVELLLDKSIGRVVPVRMVRFGVVGLSGVFVHMTTLFTGVKLLGQPFLYSQIIGIIITMTWNYFLNNAFTFKDKRLKGWRSLLGLLSFYLVCSVGAAANVGVASYVYLLDRNGKLDGMGAAILGGDAGWWIAGVAGLLVSMVWNYAVSANITWGQK